MADGRLKIDIRRNKILELLREKGKVLVTDLSQELGVTAVTVRTDLDALEADGRLERVQGGAILKPQPAAPGWNPGNEEDEKWVIARYTAEQLQDGCTLFINSGSTTRCLLCMLFCWGEKSMFRMDLRLEKTRRSSCRDIRLTGRCFL